MSISVTSIPSPPSISIQIPPSSSGPFTTSSYKTAVPIAFSPRPPSGETPPSRPPSMTLSTPPSQQPPKEPLSSLVAPNPSQAPVAGGSSSSVSKTQHEVSNSRIPGGTTSQSGGDPLGPVDVSSRELGRGAIPAPNSGDNPPSQHVSDVPRPQPQQQAQKMSWYQRIQNTFEVIQRVFHELS
jgi:hypothetical protein